jgi:ankyrin repeat protein
MPIVRLVSLFSKKYLNVRDDNDYTPTMYAAYCGKYECLKYLIDNANAKLNKTLKSNKYTLLHIGVKSGSLDIVQYLITKLGVSQLKICTKEGATVFHIAATCGHFTVLQYLLALKISKSLKYVRDLSGSTAAHDAAENGMLLRSPYFLFSTH